MIPESRLIMSEFTLRELSLPDDVLLARKSLIRWLALSLGMILPNESRRLLLDILEVLVEFHVRNENPTTRDIMARLEEQTKAKPNPKAVYYHLQRLKAFGILARKKGRYHLGYGDGKNLRETFRQFYLNKADSAFANIATALDKLENSYR
ncbi:hypothetical protein H0O00_01675 [Candidatus Micrarchaeota archaeon]|nr:hypothetical protein [Candidatus Micrarchaeota archaeon]